VAYISCIDNTNHLNTIYLLDELEFENQVLKAVPYGFTNYDYNYNNYVFYKQTNAITRFIAQHYPVNNNLTQLMALEVVAPISSIKRSRSTFNTSEQLNKMIKKYILFFYIN
jgi:hypothetical protein